MILSELLKNCTSIIPELLLSLAICMLIIADMLVPLRQSKAVCGTIGIIALLSAFLAVALSLNSPPQSFFDGLIFQDRLALLFKLVFLGGGMLTLLFCLRTSALESLRFAELVSLLLGAVIGASLMANSDNFIIFMISIETLSLCSYVLAAFLKQNRNSAEAGLKYALFGAVASAVMFFGVSYFYGLTGTLEISSGMQRLAGAFLATNVNFAAILVLLLILCGIAFKIAAVPFHSWCPDVYQGAPTPLTAFLSVVSTAAGFAALLRILSPLLDSPAFRAMIEQENSIGVIQVILGLLAILSMCYGNFTALRQTNAKRLLAYSSIAHAGYLLMGLSVIGNTAIEAVLMYIVIYLFMNLGAFWAVIALENSTGSAEIASFKGAAFKAPFLFAVLFICLVSLTGIPPTAGFAAKFRLFGVVIAEGLRIMDTVGNNGAVVFYFSLALIGVLNSVVSLFYYMKFACIMAFKQPEADIGIEIALMDSVYAFMLVIPVLLLLNFGPLAALISGV